MSGPCRRPTRGRPGIPVPRRGFCDDARHPPGGRPPDPTRETHVRERRHRAPRAEHHHPRRRRAGVRAGSRAPRPPRPHCHRPAPGRRLRRHPQRDRDGRRPAGAHVRARRHRRHRPVADHGLHADDGRRHPRDRLGDGPVPDPAGVRRGDVPVHPRHDRGRARAGLRGAAGRARRPGERHRRDDPAAHDHRADPGAAEHPRPHDGHDLDRHLGGARRRPDPVRPGAVAGVLAVDLRRHAADRPRRARARRVEGPGRHDHAGRPAGPGVARAVGGRVRHADLRPVQHRRVRGRARARRAVDPAGGRRARPRGVRRAAAAAAADHRRAAGPAGLRGPLVHRVHGGAGHLVHGHVRGADRAADLPAGRAGARHPADRPAPAARRRRDGRAVPAGGPAVRPVRPAPAGDPRCRRAERRAVAAVDAAPRDPRGRGRRGAHPAQRRPRVHDHAAVHLGARLAAPEPLRARLGDHQHRAAARGRRGHRAVHHRAVHHDGGAARRGCGRARGHGRGRPGRVPVGRRGVGRRGGGDAAGAPAPGAGTAVAGWPRPP
jgi:hypothetical protein